jgi:hypothetical protein
MCQPCVKVDGADVLSLPVAAIASMLELTHCAITSSCSMLKLKVSTNSICDIMSTAC